MGLKAYPVPGRGERLTDAVGRMLCEESGAGVSGVDLVPPFAVMDFAEQVRRIRGDIESRWGELQVLVGHSLGAFFLLVAPVLGAAMARTRGDGLYAVRPERSESLRRQILSGRYPSPAGGTDIHIGDEDVTASLARELSGSLPGCRLHVVAGAGHDLGEGYLRYAIGGVRQANRPA